MGAEASTGFSAEDMARYPAKVSEDQLMKKLSADEYKCLRRAGTERFRAGKFGDFLPKKGYFKCKACDYPLYSATSKFKDEGWDAYDKCFFTGDKAHILLRGSKSRAEAACANCGSHLGHVFYGEGHTTTNERH